MGELVRGFDSVKWESRLGVQGGVPRLSLTPLPHPGHLVDALKSYEVIFYLAGSEVALAGLFLAVATNCCRRPGTEGGARDAEDAEAEGDPEPLPAPEPSVPEALELLSPGAGPSEPEVEAEPGLAPESV